MMKANDCATATALVIGGYLRANVDNGAEANPDENKHLADALNAIRQEVSDWAENLPVPDGEDDSALEPAAITVGAIVTGSGELNRTPYNLVSVAIAALQEAVDLAGPVAVVADFEARGGLTQAVRPVVPATTKPGATAAFKPRPDNPIEFLIAGADALAAQIDAATERPEHLIESWNVLIEDLRGRGINVENACACPANW